LTESGNGKKRKRAERFIGEGSMAQGFKTEVRGRGLRGNFLGAHRFIPSLSRWEPPFGEQRVLLFRGLDQGVDWNPRGKILRYGGWNGYP